MDKSEQIPWKTHRSRLTSIYFNEKGIARVDSLLYKEFTMFLTRFESKVPKDFLKKVTKLKAEAKSQNDEFESMEPHYEHNFKMNFPIKFPKIDTFLTRDIPETVADQFAHVVQIFINFVNKREAKKIDQIRKTQASLPIAKSRDEILKCLKENQVILLAGDTGCGKSTQLPQYLLQDGYNKIACTQPRRIATMALAKRVGEEMLNPCGTEIGFQTRFEKLKSQKTRLLFLTDGLLIRQMGVDPLLSQYDVIILDEVHERHVSGDLLVALMKLAVQKRSDLKLILMSATIQLELFSKYFEGAPIIKVPGRLFPIELQYIPVKEHDLDAQRKSVKLDTGPYLKILQMIDKKYPQNERGDLLIFLNGISEMTILAESLKEYADFSKRWIVLMLHSTLSVDEQNKVFDVSPQGVRKVIISTNIAETSVTIDEIRFVIDSGKVNLIRYDISTRAQRLCETWISKASSDQRKGRAGRTGPGVCYRLYSTEQFEKMEDYTLPEIKRISLESLALQILNMDLKIDVRDFPFLEMPAIEGLNQVMENLKCQNIVQITDPRTLTPMGQILANLPVDIVVGKMLVYGVIFEQIDVALTIASGLSVQSAFTQRSFREFECVQNRQSLVSDIGDPFTLIKVYKEWLELRRRNEDTKKWTKRCGIEETRLYEIIKLRRQFKQILEDSELLSSKTNKEWEALSSRERKIKVGEKRKLFKLKEEARRETRKRRLLKEGKHFDTVLDEDTESQNPQDDINALEFQVLVKDSDARNQLHSHKMNEERAVLLKFILAIGLYPQYAVEDAHNSHQQAKEQFAHVSTKPFTILHPNSVLGQTPECLQIQKDGDGFSCDRQLIFFGLLLETTKPFLCNTTRIPALFLLIFVRNITYTSDKSVSLDGFLEYTFRSSDILEKVMNKALDLRRQITDAVNDKLSALDIHHLTKSIRKRLIDYAHLRFEFTVRRFVHVSKIIQTGIFGLDGQPISQIETDEDGMQFEVEPTFDFDELNEPTEEDEATEEVPAKKMKLFYCDICRKELSFGSNVEILRHKTSHSNN